MADDVDAREAFPLTCRYLGDKAPREASPDKFVRAVCDAYSRGDIPCRAVRDLVNYEAATRELPPAPEAPAGPLPRDDERVVLAPHVRVLVYGAALPEMLEALRADNPATPRPARGWIVAWRTRDGALHEHLLLREEGWMLERFREANTPGEALDEDEREDFARLWELGILTRAR